MRRADVVSRVCKAFAITATVLAAVALASGCAPLAVGAVAGGAAVSATEERGLGGFVSDLEIQAAINRLWITHSLDLHMRLDMTVDSGRVLILGRAKDLQQRLDAVRLAWQANGVKEVINESQVEGADTSLVDSAKDVWISTQIRSKVVVDLDIASRNYTIDTVGGVVYLMGIAKSQAELDAVLQHARSVGGVNRVVSYVRLKSASGQAAASPQNERP